MMSTLFHRVCVLSFLYITFGLNLIFFCPCLSPSLVLTEQLIEEDYCRPTSSGHPKPHLFVQSLYTNGIKYSNLNP